MTEARRPCRVCGRNRAERFFSGPRGRTCADCLKRTKRAGTRRRRLEKTYGLTHEQWEALYDSQNGRCAICRGLRGYNLDVDHDHRTGHVRGLLCKACNRHVLRHARDDADVLYRAVLYLLNPPAFRVVGRVQALDPPGDPG